MEKKISMADKMPFRLTIFLFFSFVLQFFRNLFQFTLVDLYNILIHFVLMKIPSDITLTATSTI